MTAHPEPRPLEVEQCDRDAAARVYQNFRDPDYARWVSAGTNATGDADWCIQAFARHRLAAVEAAGWRPIETMPMWDVGIVTDGERVAVTQKAEADYGGHYFAVEPEDSLEWEPTDWMPPPPAKDQPNDQ